MAGDVANAVLVSSAPWFICVKWKMEMSKVSGACPWKDPSLQSMVIRCSYFLHIFLLRCSSPSKQCQSTRKVKAILTLPSWY